MRLATRYVAVAGGIAVILGGAGVVALRHDGGDAANAAAQVAVPETSGPTSPAPATSAAPPPTMSAIATKRPKPSASKSQVSRSKPRKTSGGSSGGSGAGSASCTDPVFTTSDPNGGWSTRGYYVHNNMWNSGEAGPETLYACSHDNWYVTSTQPDSTSVKTYPNVHKDYDSSPRIDSFSTIRSSFAASAPKTGIYNVAYDVWINGIADGNSTEIMIWTDNHKQVPAGDKVARATFGGRSFDVWKESDNRYIAFVPTANMTSGTLDLLAMFQYTQSKGWLNAGATLGQIGFGVEICSTEDEPATFRFTDFSITDA